MDLLEPIARYLTYDDYVRPDVYRVRQHRSELAVSQFKSADELAELQ